MWFQCLLYNKHNLTNPNLRWSVLWYQSCYFLSYWELCSHAPVSVWYRRGSGIDWGPSHVYRYAPSYYLSVSSETRRWKYWHYSLIYICCLCSSLTRPGSSFFGRYVIQTLSFYILSWFLDHKASEDKI